MDDFGDDLFDEFEKPSVSQSCTVGVQKSHNGPQSSEEKYVYSELYFVEPSLPWFRVFSLKWSDVILIIG